MIRVTFDNLRPVVVLVERGGGSVEIPLELETLLAPRLVTVQRPAGRPTTYTVEVARAGIIRELEPGAVPVPLVGPAPPVIVVSKSVIFCRR